MRSYVAQRLALTLPVLFGVSVLVFVLARLTPGDPIAVMLGVDNYDPDTAETLRRQLGLDRSIPEQYFLWLTRAAVGDFGISLQARAPVIDRVLQALPATLLLAGTALLIAIVLGGTMGVIGAVRRGSRLDSVASFATVMGLSIPNYWLAILLIYVAAVQLRILPASGFVPITDDPISALRHLLLPAFALSLRSAAVIGRMFRSSLLEVLGEDYIRTAFAKGLSRPAVVARHALPNSMIQTITVIGIEAGVLIGGTVLIEVIFVYPGLGKLIADAIFARDYPVIQGAVLFISVAVIALNFTVDVLYARLDPRISS